MNKRVWIGIGVLLLLIGGWLGYRHWRPSGRTVGSLVPPGALLVLASNRLQDTVSAQTLRKEISLRQIPIFNEARQRLDRFLYATADTATVLKFITGKNVRYSLHALSKNTLDLIFYIPIDPGDQSFLNRLTNPDPREYRVLNHTFAGEKILDLVSRGNEPVGSFILTENVLVGSVSGILIENVAKRMHQPLKLAQPDPGSQVDADHLAGLSVRPKILQSLFVNSASLIRLFLPEELTLRFRPSSSRSHLIGYAAGKIGNRRDVAALFADQTPRRITHAELIPQTTATLYHIAISDASRFGRSMSGLLGSASSDFLRDRFSQIEPATGAFYSTLDNDILLCRMDSPSNTPRQVLVLTARDPKQLTNAYQQIAYRAGARTAGTPKTFLGHKILQLNVSELPASLFSSLFSGFPQSWITQHNSALVIANNEETLQDYLQQVQRGAVWSTDERQTDLLNNTLRPANFTAFARLNRTPTTLSATWPMAWQNLLDHQDPTDGSPALSNLENMAYQASYGNERILSTIILGRTTRRASQAVRNKVLLLKKTEFNAPLIAAPVVTGSLSNGSAQFYAQNDAGQFVLVTPEGDKIVQDTTDGPIRSNALPVDFLDNGRLQYLFMTDRTLYIADPAQVRPGQERPGQVRPGRAKRNSKTVSLQAIRLPKGLDPTFLIRPRGMQRRNLVALAAHQDGHIYALDRQSRTFVRLMAAPRKGPLLLPFQVIPTPSGMDILAVQPDGTVNYWYENGRQHPHYPARIERRTEDEPDTKMAGPALLPPGRPGIQTITEEGQLVTLNNNGLIAKRTQLFRPVRSGSFRLFPDEEQTNWLLLLTTDTEVAILDQQGQRQFEVRALQSGRNNVRYHRLGAGVELISVKSGGFTTLYDLNGRIVGDHPIPSDFPVALQFDERTNELYILSGAQRAVQLFSIRLR
ncbi:hypothetical protein [Spirosoma utsteinense]|uniref:Uncharacterized protein n=1 Tax=Spirosoma utsteinense TaxID=2585773 RepID=A0ABR6W6U7_9BACT|nr:hypothetical protein [Spirosoma utsteinense]MBC3785563.1 hypothetical protein [Spirosoma utsteinense]MBC3791711.1 hypothetical protein [Spirosoma utsteinense]